MSVGKHASLISRGTIGTLVLSPPQKGPPQPPPQKGPEQKGPPQNNHNPSD